jgi:hypothetical protein
LAATTSSDSPIASPKLAVTGEQLFQLLVRIDVREAVAGLRLRDKGVRFSDAELSADAARTGQRRNIAACCW